MIQTQILSAAIVCSVFLTVLTEARVVPPINRLKRQDADVIATEYAALMALEGLYDLYGCDEVACGVVDIYERIRRQTSDHRFDELRTILALANKNGDSNPYEIERRATSDQRYAELQSLIALANDGYMVGHGLVNPYEIYCGCQSKGTQRMVFKWNMIIPKLQFFEMYSTYVPGINTVVYAVLPRTFGPSSLPLALFQEASHGDANPKSGKKKRSVPSKLAENPSARRYLSLLRRIIEEGAAKGQ